MIEQWLRKLPKRRQLGSHRPRHKLNRSRKTEKKGKRLKLKRKPRERKNKQREKRLTLQRWRHKNNRLRLRSRKLWPRLLRNNRLHSKLNSPNKRKRD